TAVSGAPISASDYNTYQRDNLTYLFSQRPAPKASYFSGALTSTATSFTDVSTASVKLNATINSGRFFCLFMFPFYLSFSSAGVARANFRVQVDATANEGDPTYGLLHAINTTQQTLIVPALLQGLSVGAHDIRLQWKLTVTSGSGWQMNIPSVAGADGLPVFMVGWEV
ncbi:MAG: hypothetical protein KF716_09605, partial [Anaerolineae bacterium]|nr:hypothetical protein [Anaerolineae bacterium]